jgi:DNA-directed RNA polymerase I subunit RPA2
MSDSKSPRRKVRPSDGTKPTTTARSRRPAPPPPRRPVEPQTCPSYYNGYLPTVENVQRLRTLTAPHVDSFNYFLEHGLCAGIASLEPAELDLVPAATTTAPTSLDATQQQQQLLPQDVSTVQFWVENVTIAKPKKSFSTTANNSSNDNSHYKSLYPREARERGCMYSGTMTGTFCYRIIERRNYTTIPNKVVRIPNKSFGDMPIMVLSQACHLHNSTPQQLTKWKEEVREIVSITNSIA